MTLYREPRNRDESRRAELLWVVPAGPCIHKRYDRHGGCLCRVQPDWMTGGEGIRGRHNEFSGSEYEPFRFTACNHPPPCPGAGIDEETL